MSQQNQVLTVTANPAIDQTLVVPGFAAGKVNRVLESRMDAGGKGVNVATILGDLGMAATVTGLLGSYNAAIFEQHFAAHNLADRFLRIAGATRIGIKVVNPDDSETTDINFPGLDAQEEDTTELLSRVADLTIPCGWHVLSGSLPAGVDSGLYEEMIHVIRRGGGLVLLDTSGAPLRHGLATQPEIVKPNLAELEELLGTQLSTPEDAADAATQLLQGSTRLVVVSMGGDGAVFVTRKTALLARPPKVDVLSTVGAGDAMVAGLIWAECQNVSLEESARIATAFGAHAVARHGAGIDVEAVHALMKEVEIATLQPATARTCVAVEGD